MAYVTIYKTPIVVYWDSIKAFNKDRTLSGSWSNTGQHLIFDTLTDSQGQVVHAIYNNARGDYVIGWVRDDELGAPGVSEEEELRYTVVAGDTLWGISVRFGVTLNDLRTWNNLTSDMLMPGQVLIVRPGKKTIIEEDDDGEVIETTPVAMTVELNGVEYDLQDGMNAYSRVKLAPGKNHIKVKGNGTIAFHFNHEVMG